MGTFKRDFYYELRDRVDKRNVIFLLGPRKCGKTYAMLQLKQEAGAAYYDFKTMGSPEEKMDLVDRVCASVVGGEDVLYLLDEVTYMFKPEAEIAKIARSYTEAVARGVDVRTKCVLAGSQSLALERWGHRAFCSQAEYLRVKFLTYAEWLRFKMRGDVTEASYLDYVWGTREFYPEFGGVREYLQGCVDETIISNANSSNYLQGNDVDEVDVDILLDIMYLTMFTLHNAVSAQNFFAENALSDKLRYLVKQMRMKNPVCPEELARRLSKSWLGRFEHVKARSLEELEQSFAFLIRCGLITATPIFADFEHSMNVLHELEHARFRNKVELFKQVNFTINYPLFFVEVMREVLGEVPRELYSVLLGSIVECEVRGLLRDGGFEYRDEYDREIDYVNARGLLAVEISVGQKHVTHFNLIPDAELYEQVLLTKDVEEEGKIPYYKYVYELTSGRSSPPRSSVFGR